MLVAVGSGVGVLVAVAEGVVVAVAEAVAVAVEVAVAVAVAVGVWVGLAVAVGGGLVTVGLEVGRAVDGGSRVRTTETAVGAKVGRAWGCPTGAQEESKSRAKRIRRRGHEGVVRSRRVGILMPCIVAQVACLWAESRISCPRYSITPALVVNQRALDARTAPVAVDANVAAHGNSHVGDASLDGLARRAL